MSDSSKDLWFFYHRKNETKLGPFAMKSLCEYLISNTILLEHILLCKPGWPKWRKGLDVEEFVSYYQSMISKEDSILPPIDSIESDDSNESNSASKKPTIVSVPEEKDWTKVRQHPRIEMELKAVFVVDKKSFRTKTEDLSLGGIKIADPLPDFYFNKKIQVFLSSQDLKFSIKFEAELVPNKKSLTQIKFVSGNELGLKHLEGWIQSMTQNNLNKIKKSA